MRLVQPKNLVLSDRSAANHSPLEGIGDFLEAEASGVLRSKRGQASVGRRERIAEEQLIVSLSRVADQSQAVARGKDSQFLRPELLHPAAVNHREAAVNHREAVAPTAEEVVVQAESPVPEPPPLAG